MSAAAGSLVRKRYSKLQLQVLGLYAQFVRLAKNKPGLLERVRGEFRHNARTLTVKNDSLLIDYKLRSARHQLAMLTRSQVSQVKTVQLPDPANQNSTDKNNKQ